METRIHLATDHAGFEMKEFVREALLELGYEVIDHGAYDYDAEDDFPDFVTPAALAVAQEFEMASRGVIFGGSGQGEAMAANRIAGARAIAYYQFNPEIIKLSREHNDANILSIGARFISNEEAIESILFWLEIPFSENEKYQRRNEKLDQFELPEEESFR
jgi:ribose 5-phosphate isomerase B